MRHIFAIAAALVFTLALAGRPAALVPDLIPVQGVLADLEGNPVDGEVSLAFSIYESEFGGAALWSEAYTDKFVDEGFFTVYLGSQEPLAFEDLLDVDELWLGVAIGTDSEMERVRLGAVPFAIEARHCRMIGDYEAGDLQPRLNIGGDATSGACPDGEAIRAIDTESGAISCVPVAVDDHDHDGDYMPMITCSPGNVLKWSGTAWTCQNDDNTTYTAGTGLLLDGTTFAADIGFDVGQVAAGNHDHDDAYSPIGHTHDTLPGGLTLGEGLQAGGSIVTSGEVVASEDVVVGGSVEVAGDVQAEGAVRIGGDSAVCEEGSAGSIRFNSGLEVMEYCNGSNWIEMGPMPLIGEGSLDAPYTLADGSAATSCLDYRDKSASLNPGDGVYEIAPLGDSFPVYCDMSADGGGWTLVAVSAAGGTEWSWNNRSYFTNDRTTFGNLFMLSDPNTMAFMGNYKNLALHDVPIRDVKIRWSSSENTLWASYHDVGDASESVSQIIAGQQLAACEEYNRGYAMSAGTFIGHLGFGEESGYCGTRLYFNLRDLDGDPGRCGSGPRDNSSFGPSFNFRNNDGACTTGARGPFDDPSYQGFGPDYNQPTTQFGASSNTGSSFSALNIGNTRRTMLMYVR